MGDNNPTTVGDDLVYQQAMETFRSILGQVVSTSSVFATGALAIVAVAVERDSPALVGVSAAFPAAMHLLFKRWRRFDEAVLSVAAGLEGNQRALLATSLQTWRSDAWLVNYGPLIVTVALLAWALAWSVT